MRRILYYSLLCLLWVSVNSCKDEEASQPPTPSFTVDRTSGFLSDTEFTFTVEQVGAGSVSLLPYGIEKPSLGGVLIPASSFSNGKATVKFTYARVGTFQAVAVANNHSGDGGSVKNSYSPSTAIVITSDKASMGDFSFDGSTKTEVDDDADPKTVDITIPWSKHLVVNALKLRFSKSPESTVTLGGAEQHSDTTVNDFSSEVQRTYTVTSQDESHSTDYVVTVHVTPAETKTGIKSLSAIIANKGKVGNAFKTATGRVLPAYINNTDAEIVIYDTLGIDRTTYDSLSLDYALEGSFAYARYEEANGKHKINVKLAGKDTVDVTGSPADPLTISVTAEDSTRVPYDIYVAEAPILHVKFPAPLSPTISGSSNESFAVAMNVLNGTNTAAILSEFTFDLPANTTIDNVAVDGQATATDATEPFSFVADYRKPVTLLVTVSTDGVPTYVASYTITVNVLK